MIPRDPDKLPSYEEVVALVSYNAETGKFFRRKNGGRYRAGSEIGGWHRGYVKIRFGAISIMAHRVAWLLAHGSWPQAQIDHINRDRSDNRIANLRIATPSQNAANSIARIGPSGIRGVRQYRGRWRAAICVHGRCRQIGTFGSAEEARAARQVAERAAWGEFSPAATAQEQRQPATIEESGS